MRKVIIAVIVLVVIIACGLLGTDEMNHQKQTRANNPQWEQFYND